MKDNFNVFSGKYVVSVIEATGYRNTHYAIAELVDNSIQSGILSKKGKCKVDIVVIEKGGVISKILVLDNGGGMSPDILRESLILGKGQAIEDTTENRTGLGKSSKYGAGLKQSSISQCNHTEVYSWQKGKCFMSYLNTIDLKEEKYTEVPKPIEKEIPKEYLELFSFKIENSGTLIIWDDIKKKRITWKTASGLFRNAEMELGRIYRYLIEQKKVEIRLASYEEITTGNYRKTNDFSVRKNDPLFLMKDCIIEDLWTKNTGFEFHDEEIYEVPGIQSKVTIKYSVSSKEFREEGAGQGNPINVFAKKNDGVSILRNGRELELRKHEWSTGDTRDRWIGVEIHFDSELDEMMGVDAKKQRADNLEHKDIEELAKNEGISVIEFINKITENPSEENILIDISNSIQSKWSTLLKQIRVIRQGTKATLPNDSAEVSGSKALEGRKEQTKTDEDFINTNEQEKQEAIKKRILDSGEISDEKEADEFAKNFTNKNIRFLFTYTKLPGQFLFDIDYVKGTYNIIVNEAHPAYPNFINLLERADKIKPDDEPSAEKGLKLLLESWARMEDEAPENLRAELQNIRYRWGALARDFFVN